MAVETGQTSDKIISIKRRDGSTFNADSRKRDDILRAEAIIAGGQSVSVRIVAKVSDSKK